MTFATGAYDPPRLVWIALLILSFALFWPLGLAILVYLIWSGKMMCCIGEMKRWRNDALDRTKTRLSGLKSTGNTAFDEYREATLRRLEEEQRAFRDFLERLRLAKDKEEFDRFMAERASPEEA